MQSVKSQILFLFMTTGVGWIGGLFYDIYSFAFRLRRPRGWRLWFWDISFWLMMLILVFYFLLKTVWGEFRVSMLLALTLGVFLYRWTFTENKKILKLRRNIAGLKKFSANKK